MSIFYRTTSWEKLAEQLEVAYFKPALKDLDYSRLLPVYFQIRPRKNQPGCSVNHPPDNRYSDSRPVKRLANRYSENSPPSDPNQRSLLLVVSQWNRCLARPRPPNQVSFLIHELMRLDKLFLVLFCITFLYGGYEKVAFDIPSLAPTGIDLNLDTRCSQWTFFLLMLPSLIKTNLLTSFPRFLGKF